MNAKEHLFRSGQQKQRAGKSPIEAGFRFNGDAADDHRLASTGPLNIDCQPSLLASSHALYP